MVAAGILGMLAEVERAGGQRQEVDTVQGLRVGVEPGGVGARPVAHEDLRPHDGRQLSGDAPGLALRHRFHRRFRTAPRLHLDEGLRRARVAVVAGEFTERAFEFALLRVQAEALEEALDLAIYVAARLVEVDKNNTPK